MFSLHPGWALILTQRPVHWPHLRLLIENSVNKLTLSVVLDWCFIFYSVYFSDNFTWETYNAILLVRSFSKYFIELLPNEEVIRHMGGSVVKSQSDEEVAGFTGQVLHCTGHWAVMQTILSNQWKKYLELLIIIT